MNLPGYHHILFLDIETVSQFHTYELMPSSWQELWSRKVAPQLRDKTEESSASLYGQAGLWSEFGKIICISCGYLSGSGKSKKLTVKSFHGHDEKVLLQEFSETLQRWGTGAEKFLCAHNGKEFDFPYLVRRMIIHYLDVPSLLDPSGKKKWESNFLDTLELWKFGEYKHFTSLALLAETLGIPTPKDDLDGSMVNQVYWEERDLDRIVRYCQKDVLTLAQIYLRLCGEAPVEEDQIETR